MKKRIVSMLLALVMVCSVLGFAAPASAKAEKIPLPSISKNCYIRAYTLLSYDRAYPYENETSSRKDYSHWIDRGKDECHIIAISGNRVKVDYPDRYGNYGKARWFDASEFFSEGRTYAVYHCLIGGDPINTYRRSNLKEKYGYIAGTYDSYYYCYDDVWVIRYCNGACQVLYEVDAQYGGGYKLAWAKDCSKLRP